MKFFLFFVCLLLVVAPLFAETAQSGEVLTIQFEDTTKKARNWFIGFLIGIFCTLSLQLTADAIKAAQD